MVKVLWYWGKKNNYEFIYFEKYREHFLFSTLTNLTLIILFIYFLKFSKIISSKIKKIFVNENSEYLGIFIFLKWKFQNELINYSTDIPGGFHPGTHPPNTGFEF